MPATRFRAVRLVRAADLLAAPGADQDAHRVVHRVLLVHQALTFTFPISVQNGQGRVSQVTGCMISGLLPRPQSQLMCRWKTGPAMIRW